ncbi:serine/threonine-protein phosphatase 6 regulatory ankyrin repeat subunit C-like [Halyomorpha halys]|uniref:serine/threonine-protein phosphatase 6 regulatory ankyrin repeat subunit C-like n=1 Tax=Halyomorpha halys TaxID=286706 RepID=UPI0006D51ED3
MKLRRYDNCNVAIDKNQMTPLHIASRDGSSNCVKVLLPDADRDIGDKWQNYAIHYAALNGHEEIARMILDKDSQERRRINVNHETPLFLASREGHTDVVTLLLQDGMDDFQPDLNGRTPLHRSASRGHFEVVKLLLSSMANRDTEDKWGFTPLNYAASWRGYQDVIGYLSTSQLNITLSYFFEISDPFQQNNAEMTTFFM